MCSHLVQILIGKYFVQQITTPEDLEYGTGIVKAMLNQYEVYLEKKPTHSQNSGTWSLEEVRQYRIAYLRFYGDKLDKKLEKNIQHKKMSWYIPTR